MRDETKRRHNRKGSETEWRAKTKRRHNKEKEVKQSGEIRERADTDSMKRKGREKDGNRKEKRQKGERGGRKTEREWP